MTIDGLRGAMEAHAIEHGFIRLDPEARSKKHYRSELVEGTRSLRVEQVLVDSEELNDWSAIFEVDVAKSDEKNEVALELIQVGAI